MKPVPKFLLLFAPKRIWICHVSQKKVRVLQTCYNSKVNPEIIYLDHAAATPVDDRVLAAMLPYMVEQFYNPSSPYAPAVQVRRDYQEAKRRIAIVLGGRADELVMTAGATESIALAFCSGRGHVVTSAIEHASVLAAARSRDHTIVEVTPRGIVTAEVIRAALRPDTYLVSVALANNELGTIQPIRDIAEVVHAERNRRREAGDTRPIHLHCDASQGLGQIDVNVARLGVDMLTVNAGKLGGPKQVACLWAASSVRLTPLMSGGGQERGLRSGTENVAGVVGFARAIELAHEHRNYEAKRLAGLRDQLQARLITAFPQVVVSGHPKRRLPGFLHISFAGIDAERLVFLLEARGVLVATGSACAANKNTRSHVLAAIGLAPELADGSVRLTLGRLNDEANIARAGEQIIAAVEHEYARLRR